MAKKTEEPFGAYCSSVNEKFGSGMAKELAYRTPLENFLKSLFPKYRITNEPSSNSIDCGKPDMSISDRDYQMLCFIETKDINVGDLDGEGKNQEQFERYKHALSRIIFTDYLDFHFYENGKKVEEIRIGNVKGGKVEFSEEDCLRLQSKLKKFVPGGYQMIKNSETLATLMAQKARLMSTNISQVLNSKDDTSVAKKYLMDFCDMIKQNLMPNLTIDKFGKIYSQTLVYGLFAARLHDETKDTFSRSEAAALIPQTNLLLRGIFNELAGNNIHPSISWIVDDLVNMFLHSDLDYMFDHARKLGNDPLVHFYEDFLRAFDPKDKQILGVWYTPLSVVDFIVNSVDWILRNKFDIEDGLADRKKTDYKVGESITQQYRVQILDPAVGTGTFLAEVANHIYKEYQDQPTAWKGYVHSCLLQRLYGFEIQMASYTIAHIKMDMVLAQTGYKTVEDDCFNISLTDSLIIRASRKEPTANFWINQEFKTAEETKSKKRIMVLVGNPPYNGESQNKDANIQQLMNDYKREPNSKKSIEDTKWVNNDYVKFVRLAQDYIDTTGEGIMGYIMPNSYLDSLTFRGMRYALLRTYDEIYILNLHGDARTKDGGPDDENVFDIQPGVCINFFIKYGANETGKKNDMARVYYADLTGKRKDKFDYLLKNQIPSVGYQELEMKAPMYFFTPIDFTYEEEFFEGFTPKQLFKLGGVGMCSKRDEIAYQDSLKDMKKVISDFESQDINTLRSIYPVGKESSEWNCKNVKNDIVNCKEKDQAYKQITYRPFDKRWTFQTSNKGLIARPVYSLMKNLAFTDTSKNLGLIVGQSGKVVGDMPWNLAFVTDAIVDLNVFYRGGGYVYPLYGLGEYKVNPETHQMEQQIISNLDPDVYNIFVERLGEEPTPENVLYYVYAVLYSPEYRRRYKDFLRLDFPHIPYPKDANTFDTLASLGKKLCDLHLLRGCDHWHSNQLFPCRGDGNGIIEYGKWKEIEGVGRVYINKTQYYDNVPKTVWEFYIGGYQPAQKWLKDHKGLTMSYDAVMHYSDILYALSETTNIMNDGKIDGWG